MVFESYVVELLNKYAGQYLENLDSSQLTLGIWGGDAQLENLILKESALDDLDLPVKVLRGHLGKLVLKIPWTNLYSEPVVAKIDGLYLLVQPNTVVKYNAEKEEKAKLEKKQRQLEAIELARQLEEEKKKAAPQKEEKSDSFVEKLAMQIVKNLQVSVCNIHIRYEDSATNPSAPFSVGVTLENLSAESTDENWIPAIVGKSVQLIHKLVKLDSLALYWNTNDDIGKLPTQQDWVNQAKGGIATTIAKHYLPPFKYILQPISATTKVKLNVKAGSDLNIPKVFLSLVLQELSLVLMRQQYHDVMQLLESFDRMTINSAFRKYKPSQPLHGHAKQWWKYAMSSILEEDVRRRLRNWSWKHMKQHRALCREYKELYKQKLLKDKPSDSVLKGIEKLEKKLDVLNITICRQQAAFEEATALRKKKKKAEEKEKSGGFFSGLFGSKKKGKKEEEEKSEILTEEQKKEELEKLYAAIGYSEGEVITAFPKEYVENKVTVHLKQISVCLRDDTTDKPIEVSRLSFKHLFADLAQRPSAQAIKVTAKVDEMKMFGSATNDGKMPLMMSSQSDQSGQHIALFTAAFETNPLDGKCDQRAVVTSQPVKIIYDANTVQHVISFFQPPKDVHLQELSAAAYSRLEDLKSVSKASLAYAVEHHKITDVNVDVKSPFIIIPEGGVFTKSCSVLVVDLGHLKITSDPEQERVTSTKDLSVSDLESKCYDKFDLRLEDLQILVAKSGEDWQAARKKVKSDMHILDPMGFGMKLHKALNPDDIRLAQIKVSGSLPSVKIHVSDDKLAQVIKLAKSIPIPSSGEVSVEQISAAPVDIKFEGRKLTGLQVEAPSARLKVLSSDDEKQDDDEDEEYFTTPPETFSDEYKLEKNRKEANEAMAKQVKVSLKFEIEEIVVDVGTVDSEGKTTPCLVLSIRSLGTSVAMHPWDLVASASLGSLALQEMSHGPQGVPLYLVHTPPGAELLTVSFVKVESDHPEYDTTYNSTQQSVTLEFSSLQVVLHQEALLSIMELSGKLLPPSDEASLPALPGPSGTEELSSEQEIKESPQASAKKGKRKGEEKEVQLEVKAKLGGITVTVTSVDGELSRVIIGGLSAYCALRATRTEVKASMKNLSLLDTTPGALYPKIVSIVNQEVFHLEVVAYNDATSGGNFRNMEAVDVKFQAVIGCIRVVFLNKFVMNLLAFLNKFQRAKDALEYARKSAAESATATIQSLQTQSSRISLSVSIQAPLIIIPVSSTSLDALVANLGHLTVSNSFTLLHAGEDTGGSDAVVTDNMVVELNSVQLLRTVMADAENIGATRLVLEPMNLAVYIARNLSPWYHQVPDVDVVGKLFAVKLSAGEDDLRTLLAIVFQNLSEGVNSSQTEPSIMEEPVEVDAGQVLESAEPSKTLHVQRSMSEEPWNTVKFLFEIEEVSVAIYWKETGPPSGDEAVRVPVNCLGQFSLSRISTSGKIKSDSSIAAKVSLGNCVLDDKRPQSEQGVTRMIERYTGGSSDVKNMIDVNFQQAFTQDKTIDIGVQNVHVVVNLEFLLFLSNVFISALATDSPDSEVPTSVREPSKAVAIAQPAAVKTVDKEPPQIIVQITIKDPEIVLLADAKDKDTNALFLKNAVDFRFVKGQGQQKMSGSVSDLVIFSAAFDKGRRDSSKSRVLQLSHISLLSSAPEGGNMHIDISAAMAYIHVSPPTIRTLTACLTSLAPAKSEEDKEKSTEEALDLWAPESLSIDDRWYLSPVPKDQIVPGRRVLARSFANIHKYDSGYVMRVMEAMIMVHFDQSLFTFIDPNDVTGIVIDKDPDPKELRIGCDVIAKRPKETWYMVGKIIQAKDEQGERLFLVDFWDGVEHWNTLNKIRLVTTSKPGVPKGQVMVSSIVFVRGKDEFYRKGFVSSKTYSKIVVRVFGEGQVTHDVNDSAAVVPDVVPDPAVLTVGATVIATFDRSVWQAGHIVELKKLEDNGKDIYRVRFIGGGDTWVFSLNNIRILLNRKREVPQGVLAVGTVVWAHTSKIRYYKGFVSYKGSKLHVDLYDGDKFLYDLKDARSRVIPDVPPRAADIKPGTRVIAKFKNKPRYYSSTVLEVDASDSNEPRYHVKLDDGDESWNSLYHLRLLPTQVQVEGDEKPPDHVDATEAGNRKTELLVFEMEGFDIKLEGMFGGQVIPLLSVDGSIQGELKNWSTALSARVGVALIGNYFNENVSEWEPLLEPVEDEKQVYRPWELNVEFSMANGGSNGENEEDDSSEAAMSLAIESKDILELTVTKSCLDVFAKLGAAFSEAVTLQGTGVVALEDVPPYQIWNELGMDIKIRPGDKFAVPGVGDDGMVALCHGKSLSLRFGKGVVSRSSRFDRGSSTYGGGPTIGIEVQGYHELKTISVKQARVVLHSIIPKKLLAGLIAFVVIQVETGEGQKIVTIRSPLQVYNRFPIPMEVLCKRDEQLSRIATVQPDSIFSVPLVLAHRAALFMRPAGFGYGESTTPLLWNKLASEGHASVQCPAPAGEGPPFHIEVDCEKVAYSAVHGSLEHAPNYVLHVYPPAILHNYLPCSIHYATEGLPFLELKGGDKWPLFSVRLSRKVVLVIQVDNYHNSSWKGQIELSKQMDELTTFTLESTSPDAYGKCLELGVFSTFEGTRHVTLYSPYWMVNKTGLYLDYKASDDETVIPHPVSMPEPVMFSYRGKGNLFAKKTARVRLAGSDWSNKFSLDAAGSGGALKITKNGNICEVGMQITLSYFSLTKIVEFTPFHLINNHTEHLVSLTDSEEDVSSSWITVQPGECAPFWPKSCPSKNLVIKVGDSSQQSARFDFEPDATVLLRLNGKISAVCAQMLTKDSAAIVTITPYYAGAAPVRLENCTPLKICYKQKGCKQHVLPANQCVLFTWDEPTADKEFEWFVEGSDNKITAELSNTSQNSFEVDGHTFYWATFLDGLQRVLLFIDDFTLAYRTQVEQKERTAQQITVGLQGVGLSLVNNDKSTEVAYVGIRPSAIIWEEQKKKGRWKPLKIRLCDEFEAAWTKVEQDLSVGKEPNYTHKTGDIEVDFKLMEIVRPNRQPIRRSFTPGVSLEYMTSPNQMQLFAKINSVQIDSQVPGSTFQTALVPVPPPKSLAADNAPKPYIELSLVTKQEEHSHVNEIKYFKVLIQEMDAKIDMGFLMALIGLFSSDTIDRSQEASQYSLDNKRVYDKLGEAYASQGTLSNNRNFFDYFHLSPLKVHLSFSQLGGGGKDKTRTHIGGSFLSLLLKSVGVAVTEVQDVEFKLAYFEIKNKVYTQQQLIDVAVKHYSSQALKQMYVLVLGLDVLGNPFGLITGLKEGAKDFFYEPYQGLIRGPGEFAEGLAIGARSLFGHTVGGAAGAVSRITGTLGKGIAALTMDDKYQQERRQAMGKKPVNVKEGLTRGGKGLLEGVVGGVTGIVTKPMEGAKQAGAAGFFKGLGKGVVGVLARPAGGLVDFASSTLEGIKGSASTGSEVKRLRPPRCFYADKVIKPYNLHEAEGNAVLQEAKKDKATLETDTYFCHCRLNSKKALIVTNKHVIVVGRTEVFDSWECDWMCPLQGLVDEPTTDGQKLVLKVSVKSERDLDKTKGKGIFKRSQASVVRTILTPSPQIAQWVVGKIKEARS